MSSPSAFLAPQEYALPLAVRFDYFQVPLSYRDVLQSSQVIGKLLSIPARVPLRPRVDVSTSRCRYRTASLPRRPTSSDSPFVSLLPAIGPQLLPGAAIALCRRAVIPRHGYPPLMVEIGVVTKNRRSSGVSPL